MVTSPSYPLSPLNSLSLLVGTHFIVVLFSHTTLFLYLSLPQNTKYIKLLFIEWGDVDG